MTETGTGSSAATITNADAVAKIETEIATGATVTVIETKETAESGEGRGRMALRTPLMQRGKEVMMYPMLRPVPILEIQKKSTQSRGKSLTALAETRVNLRSDLRRALHGKFFVDVSNVMAYQVLPSPPSPAFEQPQDDYNPEEPKDDDSETRSAFVSQLAARLTARDLGYFFEDKLGEGTVLDSRIVTDRISRRSKGCDLLPCKLGVPLIALTASAMSSSEQWSSSRKHST